MPTPTPKMDERRPPDGAAFVADVLASNLRAYRRLRDEDQSRVAQRMTQLGHRWVRATVSEVERGRRNVTVPEMISLCLVLGATVDALLDPRGPERRSGLLLALDNPSKVEEGSAAAPLPSNVVVDGDKVSGLICGHGLRASIEWVGPTLKQVRFREAPPARRDGEPTSSEEVT